MKLQHTPNDVFGTEFIPVEVSCCKKKKCCKKFKKKGYYCKKCPKA